MESALRRPLPDGLKVIETLGWYPEQGAVRLEAHLERAEISCATFGFYFDRAEVMASIAALDAEHDLRLRLTWGADGFEWMAMPKGEAPTKWTVAIHKERLSSEDPWLRVKTTQRRLYDQARADLPNGIHEWLFLNERGHLCEGTITNLFALIDGQMLTPHLADGVLPGILRAQLIEDGKVKEGTITEDALQAASELYLGNSLRGLIPAVLAD